MKNLLLQFSIGSKLKMSFAENLRKIFGLRSEMGKNIGDQKPNKIW
jgi:hypothetical protein